MLHADAGIHLPESKAALVYSRLAKRLRALGLASFRDYCALVAEREGARRAPENARRAHHQCHPLLSRAASFRASRETGLCRRCSRRLARARACGSGRPPAPTARSPIPSRSACSPLMPDAGRFDVKILATDIDPNMLAEAERGVYAELILEPVPAKLRGRWFAPARGARGERPANLLRRRGAAPAGRVSRAQSRRPLADEGTLPGYLLPQRRRSISTRRRRPSSGAASRPCSPRRTALHRPFRTGHGSGRRSVRKRGRHDLSAEGGLCA